MKVLMTGGTRGIGRAAAIALAKQGCELVLVARDAGRAQETVKLLEGAKVDVLSCDLSSQKDIRRLAAEFKQKHGSCDVLLNNAGGMFTKREETVDGLEWTFAVNHLGYFLLTNLLLDSIKERVVSTSSGAHLQGHIDFDDLMFEKRAYFPFGMPAYSASKLANILFTRELARRAPQITANCFHPGFVHSGFGHHQGGLVDFGLKLLRPFQKTVEQGADTLIHLATSPEVAKVTGQYFIERKIRKGSPESRDLEKAKKLWEISEKLTGLN
jgi:NAD(P)-dependent dehydrogenase (short-subunit alcohol dehydrogenase family)